MATMYYRPYTAEPLKDGELPPHDAMDSVLPDYQYIFSDPGGKTRQAPGQYIASGSSEEKGQAFEKTEKRVIKKHSCHNRPPDNLGATADQGSMGLLDYQMHELEKYRSAVHKMGQDIVTLRQHIRDLESNNGDLRRDLSNYNDATRLLLDSQDLDGLTKPELAARYVALKQKLTGQTNELADYKDRVQKLHNELIKKNDQEKEYLKLSHAHFSQNELLQRLQEKADKVTHLTQACKKQEKVIERLERLLQAGAARPQKGDNGNKQAMDAIVEENRRLRAELVDLRDELRNQQVPQSNAQDDLERLQLLERLERYEGRVNSLEQQLTDNARKWGKEKSDMVTKLQEAEYGFKRAEPWEYTHKDFAYLNAARSLESSMTDPSSRRYSKYSKGKSKSKSKSKRDY